MFVNTNPSQSAMCSSSFPVVFPAKSLVMPSLWGVPIDSWSLGPFNFLAILLTTIYQKAISWCKWDIPRLWIDSRYLQESSSFCFYFLNSQYILVHEFNQFVIFFNRELWSSSLKPCTSQVFTVVLLNLDFSVTIWHRGTAAHKSESTALAGGTERSICWTISSIHHSFIKFSHICFLALYYFQCLKTASPLIMAVEMLVWLFL